MRVRWGRVVLTAGATPAAAWAAAVAALWATAPAPSPGARAKLDATEPCEAAAVLQAGLGLGKDAGPAAGAVVTRAAQCATLGDLPDRSWFEVYQLMRDGIPTLRAQQPPAAALDQLLDLWELAGDEQNNGGLVHLAVWTAVGLTVAPEVGLVLTDPDLPAEARADAEVRLDALGRREVDWEALHPFEERSAWAIVGRMAAEPGWWSGLVGAPHLVWVARRGTHPIVADFREDLVTLRAQAKLLERLAAG
ncbi:MAG: hypothetical protein ABMA64_14880 [Myxococcota bacterium]